MTVYLALVAAHAATGYLLAVGIDGFLWGDSRWAALRGVAGWVALAGGARALHAAFARPAPSRAGRLSEAAAATMVAALLLSFTLTPGYRVATAACFVLGLLYAVPPLRLAERRGWGTGVAALALGFLTPYAGLATTSRALDLVTGLALMAFAPLATCAGALPARPGTAGDVRIAVAGSAAAFGCWVVAWMLRGDPWYVPAGGLPGLVSLAIAFAAWTHVLLSARRSSEATGPEGPRGRRMPVGAAWLLTDAAIIATFAW